jgi:hypothetical protein
LQRPSFTWTIDESKGTIEVQEQGTLKATKATLRYATSLNDKRRDFRLIIGKINGKCPFPASVEIKGNCVAPYLWHSKEIKRTGDKFIAQVDIPKGKNRWVGYFIEMQ